MKISDLNKEYDRLQMKYGAKELNSIYNGGCVNNPDICFVFMNPTGKNIASAKTWTRRRSPSLGTKNIWRLFYNVNLICEDTFKALKAMKPESIDMIFADPPYFLSNDGITCQAGRMVSAWRLFAFTIRASRRHVWSVFP